MNNLKELKSTVVGIMLFLIGVVITLIEYFTVDTIEWTHYILPIAFTAIGIGFMLSPDRLLDFFFGWAKKKIDK